MKMHLACGCCVRPGVGTVATFIDCTQNDGFTYYEWQKTSGPALSNAAYMMEMKGVPAEATVGPVTYTHELDTTTRRFHAVNTQYGRTGAGRAIGSLHPNNPTRPRRITAVSLRPDATSSIIPGTDPGPRGVGKVPVLKYRAKVYDVDNVLLQDTGEVSNLTIPEIEANPYHSGWPYEIGLDISPEFLDPYQRIFVSVDAWFYFPWSQPVDFRIVGSDIGNSITSGGPAISFAYDFRDGRQIRRARATFPDDSIREFDVDVTSPKMLHSFLYAPGIGGSVIYTPPGSDACNHTSSFPDWPVFSPGEYWSYGPGTFPTVGFWDGSPGNWNRVSQNRPKEKQSSHLVLTNEFVPATPGPQFHETAYVELID